MQNNKRDDKLDAMLYGMDPLMRAIVRAEACCVKPIIVKLPEDVDPEEFIKKLKVGSPLHILDEESKGNDLTDYQKEAYTLYNAFLYKLQKVKEAMEQHESDAISVTGAEVHLVFNVPKDAKSEDVISFVAQRLMES